MSNSNIARLDLVVIAIFLQSFSFLSIKYATMHEGFYTAILLVLAFIFIGARAIVWQMILKLIPLSKAYPFSSLVQVLIFLYAVVLFDEQIYFHNILGLFLMLSGLTLIAKSQ